MGREWIEPEKEKPHTVSPLPGSADSLRASLLEDGGANKNMVQRRGLKVAANRDALATTAGQSGPSGCVDFDVRSAFLAF
jgi:hypothetical protein